jgi:hypothetical protein
MMVAYFSIGWVHILALNSTLPTAAKWVATTIMMAGFILYIRGMGLLRRRSRRGSGRLALRSSSHLPANCLPAFSTPAHA